MELILESKQIYLDIENHENIIETSIDGVLITEKYQPNNESHGRYQIVLKKQIVNLQDLTETASKLKKIAQSFNDLLTYVIGFPLNIDAQDFYGSKIKFAPVNKIEGWQSNYDDVLLILQKKENPEQRHFGKITIGSITHTSTLKETPLPELIKINQNYSGLDNISKMLIRFHLLALTNEYDVKYLLLGKALEIAKELLPVKGNTSESFKHLPPQLQKAFKERTISWLYEMSNHRLETRHAINSKSEDKLHNEMTKEEYYDFLYLSDLLISNIVRTKLGLEPLIFTAK